MTESLRLKDLPGLLDSGVERKRAPARHAKAARTVSTAAPAKPAIRPGASSPSPEPVRKPVADDLASPAALGALGRDWLRQFERNRAGALSSEHAEFVHQLRVGLRRLRCLIRLFADMDRKRCQDAYTAVGTEMRWLAGVLGESRDLDVFVDEVLPSIAPGLADPCAAALRRCAMRLQVALRVRTRQALEGERAARLPQLLQDMLGALAGRSPALSRKKIESAITGTLERRTAKVRKGTRRPELLPVDALHRLRIDVKKLRYLAEMLAPLCDALRVRPYLAAVADLQARLGRLQDLTRARALIDRLAEEPAASTPAPIDATGCDAQLARQTDQALAAIFEAARAFRPINPFWRKPAARRRA